MGDLMHAFPALTEAAKHHPGITFDWVVDEGFAEVPLWHPNVDKVITTAHRRWRKNLTSALKTGEFKKFYNALNLEEYDAVVDMQSNLKSATVSWLRKGSVSGYDSKTCREKPAHLAYSKRYHVPIYQHAIERQRELLANALDYKKADSFRNYGVELSSLPLAQIDLPKKYLVFVHNASWETKLWPTENWIGLLQRASEQGYSVLLPCGNEKEYSRAKKIAGESPSAIALPKMSLNDIASIMCRAQAAVCCDTGLAHLAAVVALPAITLYAVTDTVLIGTFGENQLHISAGNNSKANMADITIETVWQKLNPLL